MAEQKEKKQELFARQALTSEELVEIESLAHICNTYEGLDMKLNWDVLYGRSRYSPNVTNDFLYYEDEQLVGFLALFSFNSKEAEVSGMVHPDYRRRGIFTQLFHMALAECKRRSFQDVILIVEHTSHGGQSFVKPLGTQYHHSEYKMELVEVKRLPIVKEGLQTRLARPDETQALAHITAVAFDMVEADMDWYATNGMGTSDTRRNFVAALNNVPIGKLEVVFNTHEAVIYGFGVLPAYRGHGYGRQLLAYTIQEILTAGQRRIVLEVVVENRNALSLYHSCGFQETRSYDYYFLLT